MSRTTVLRPRSPALIGLLAATAVLYMWGLGSSKWANAFYSAAVQAGAHSWKAFFFGSSDAANFITVDKTPLSLWPMELTARVFGVNTWSILVPQALMGVATVLVLFRTVRRSLGHLGPRAAYGGALLAGAVLATTPVAALMFRFNNPDALLVLLLTLAAYGLVRALETARTGWLVFAASCVGLGFLAKMMQAFLVVPAFALVWLLAAPTPVRRRLWQLVLAGVALVVAGGWWVAIVAAVPAGSRPYIGGSQHNSVLELALGYNGLGRLNGNETGGLGNLNQDAGWTRMFGAELGGQIAWLLPAALLLLVTGLYFTRLSPPAPGPNGPPPDTADRVNGPDATSPTGTVRSLTDTTKASPANRTPTDVAEPGDARPDTARRDTPGASASSHNHTDAEPTGPSRTLAGPGDTQPDTPDHNHTTAEPVGAGGSGLPRTAPRWAAFALWGGWLLVTDATFSFMQGIFHGYYTVALAPAVAALVGMGSAVLWRHRRHPGASVALAFAVALTAWWSWTLLGRTPDFHSWLRLTVLIAGLAAALVLLAAGRLPGRVLVAGAAVAIAASLAGPAAYAADTAATPHTGAIPTAGPSSGGFGGPGGFGRQGGRPPGAGRMPGRPPGGTPRGPGRNPAFGTGGGAGGGMLGGGRRGGAGTLLDAATPSAALTALLKQDAGKYTWIAAAVGSNSASGYQLATDGPVMAVGGFNGTDPAPSLAQFQRYVRDGRIHYFIGGSMTGGRGGGSGSDDAQRIAAWVQQTYTARTVGAMTVYDLSHAT